MAEHIHDPLAHCIDQQLKQLCDLLQEKEIDVHHLNWLCDLYYCAPPFLKYVLLSILQMFSGRCDSCQLQNRVKFMLVSYPLSPQKLNIGTSGEVDGKIGLSKCYISLVKTMAKSHSLMNRLAQHQIHQQLHHQPAGNSIIIPEKLMSGEAAFLNVSKSTCYKPIIFDCTLLESKKLYNRIDVIFKSGIKPEIAGAFDEELSSGNIERLFFYWLAAHHRNESVSPVWLTKNYQSCSETAKPYCFASLLDGTLDVEKKARLKLSPERIKEYFNLPSAVVLQKDDLFVLLDEYLSLIAT